MTIQNFLRMLMTFLVSMACGSASFEIADYINRVGYAFDMRRALLIGAVFGVAWIPASYFAKKSFVSAALVGCMMPILVPLATIIGIWLVFFVIAFGYVFFPIGIFNGFLVYTIWYRARQIKKESERDLSDLMHCQKRPLASVDPYQPPRIQ